MLKKDLYEIFHIVEKTNTKVSTLKIWYFIYLFILIYNAPYLNAILLLIKISVHIRTANSLTTTTLHPRGIQLMRWAIVSVNVERCNMLTACVNRT